METLIRNMEASDIPAALELWAGMEGLAIRGSDNLRDLSMHLVKNPLHNFVALEGDSLTGTVLGGFDGRRGYIYHLAVHESHRKKLTGRRLMERCFDSFREAGISKCHMMVLKNNRDAQEFYRRIGCEQRDEIIVFSKTLIP